MERGAVHVKTTAIFSMCIHTWRRAIFLTQSAASLLKQHWLSAEATEEENGYKGQVHGNLLTRTAFKNATAGADGRELRKPNVSLS